MAEVRFEESLVIAVEPERVFDYRLDFTTLPQYNANVSNLRRTDAGTEPGEGASYLFDLQLPGMPEPMESPLRVLSVERPHRFTYETGPGFMATGDSSFEPTPEGTRVTFGYTLRFPGEVDQATAETMAASGREDARVELANIKKLLEG